LIKIEHLFLGFYNISEKLGGPLDKFNISVINVDEIVYSNTNENAMYL